MALGPGFALRKHLRASHQCLAVRGDWAPKLTLDWQVLEISTSWSHEAVMACNCISPLGRWDDFLMVPGSACHLLLTPVLGTAAGCNIGSERVLELLFDPDSFRWTRKAFRQLRKVVWLCRGPLWHWPTTSLLTRVLSGHSLRLSERVLIIDLGCLFELILKLNELGRIIFRPVMVHGLHVSVFEIVH